MINVYDDVLIHELRPISLVYTFFVCQFVYMYITVLDTLTLVPFTHLYFPWLSLSTIIILPVFQICSSNNRQGDSFSENSVQIVSAPLITRSSCLTVYTLVTPVLWECVGLRFSSGR